MQYSIFFPKGNQNSELAADFKSENFKLSTKIECAMHTFQRQDQRKGSS